MNECFFIQASTSGPVVEQMYVSQAVACLISNMHMLEVLTHYSASTYSGITK